MLVGPLPPPVDGRALATSWLVDALAAAGCEVEVIDTQLPAGRLRVLRKALRCLRGALAVLLGGRLHMVVIASGNHGLLLELAPLLAARLRGTRAHLAHHGSQYVRHARWPMRLALKAGGPALRHIFLCEPMRDAFGATYGVDIDQAVILDNAALVPGFHDPSVQRKRSILHLSNLSRAKGSLTAMSVASRLPVPLLLAGPADQEVRDALDHGRSTADVEHLGPVRHDEKGAILSASRVFLFPSEYEFEAQPLVLYEAASAGTIPVACDVGWVRDQLTRLGLSEYVVRPGDTDALAHLCRQLIDLPDDEFAEISARTMARFQSLKEASVASTAALAVELGAARGPAGLDA